MFRERADKSGCDVHCDMCGQLAYSHVRIANIIVAEVCQEDGRKIQAMIEAQLLTRPADLQSLASLGESTQEVEREPETRREGQN